VFAICNAEDAEVEAAKDPATYYGHHEAEFGMSWCAGFTRASALPALCLHCLIL
jgi:fructosamine-3-kinase